MAIAPNGDIFVADGHGRATTANARIVKFDKNGKFIKAWGKKGTGVGEFDCPHTLAFDSRGRLFVGDRQNNRIQIFDQDGNFIAEWKQFGRPSGIFIDKDDVLYVADSESRDGEERLRTERGMPARHPSRERERRFGEVLRSRYKPLSAYDRIRRSRKASPSTRRATCTAPNSRWT